MTMHPIDVYGAWISGLTGDGAGQGEQEKIDVLIQVLDHLLSLPDAQQLQEFGRYDLALKNARAGYAGVSTLSDALVAVSWRLQQGIVAQPGDERHWIKRALHAVRAGGQRHV